MRRREPSTDCQHAVRIAEGGTNRLDVDRGEEILEDRRHELELLVLASESGQNELWSMCQRGSRGGNAEIRRTKGLSANSRPTLLGRRAIRSTSLASE